MSIASYALIAVSLVLIGIVIGMVFGEMNSARNHHEAIAGWDLLNTLRAPEGAEVVFCCDNPDFNGEPNSVVDVCDDWTEWHHREFKGDTVLEALQAAYNERLAS